MTAVNVERKLAAIVKADVKGYTLMMGADEERTLKRIATRIDQMSRRIQRYSGRLVSTAGDGLLAEFPSPVNAVRFAVAAQREAEPKSQQSRAAAEIRFRIGIHVGDVLVHKGTVGGDAVNVAVRLEEIAEPGGICLSRTVFEQVHRTLRLPYEYVGEPPLKNIKRAVGVYRLSKAAVESSVGTDESRRAGLPLPTGPSLAVLPFENLLKGRRDSYLCNGLTEDIITALSRFRHLFIIGRHSSFLFRDAAVSPQETARQLGVRYILRGSVRSIAGGVRVTCQLSDGIGGNEIWADRYDCSPERLLSVQDEVVEMIVARLAVNLDIAEHHRIRAVQTRDLEAYGFVLRGLELLANYTRDDNRLARESFEKATARDPHYARAYAALSRTYNLDWRYSWAADRAGALDQALTLARKAVSLDSRDARGHAELGFALLYKKEVDAALKEYERALELNPNDPDVLAEYADALVYDDRAETSLEIMDRAMRLNPYYPDWYLWYLADAYSSLHRYEDVIATVLRMNDPQECARLLAASFAHLGRLEEARLYAGEVRRRHPDFSISKWAEVLPHKTKSRVARFASGLRLAGLPD